MSKKLDQSLIDAYVSIYEAKRGHAAGSSDSEKQASQLASDVRYKAKGKLKPGVSEEEKKKIFLQILNASPASGPVKAMAKQKLLGEDVVNEMRFDDGPEGTKKRKEALRKKRGMTKAQMDKHPQFKTEAKESKVEPPREKLKTDRDMFQIPKKERDDAKARLLAKAAAKRKKMKKEEVELGEMKVKQVVPKKAVTQNPKDMSKKVGEKAPVDYRMLAQSHKPVGNIFNEKKMDPVGQEDGDINNDGKKDGTDKYLANRRKAIGKAIAKKRGRVKEGFSAWRIDLDFNEQVKK